MGHALKQQGFSGGRMLHALATLLVLALCAGGCGSRKSFPDGDIRSVEGVYYGTVLDVSDVIVEEDPSIVGPVVGAALGGLLGSQFGGGTGRLLLTAAGISVGAEAGRDLQKRRYKAMQITMELDNGKLLLVVQGFTDYFVRGDKVRIIHTGKGRATVQHI